MKIWSFLKKQMLKNPTQYICENNAEMNYADLVAYAEIFAKKLASETCCAVMCNSEMAQAIGILSCFAANVTVVPISLKYGEAHCKRIIKFISPSALITDLNGELNILKFDVSNHKRNKDVALIMCTSGTTGTPKGVMLSHKNIICNVSDISQYYSLNSKDSILISRPLYHSGVLTGEFLLGLIRGARVRFYSDKFNPYMILNLINQYSITSLCATPTMWNAICRCCREPNHTLKSIGISGECLSRDIGNKILNTFPNAKIHHGYGLTEASPRVSYLPYKEFKYYMEYVGIPLRSVKIKILTHNGKIAKQGESGILWVQGNNVMMGYYQSPELTRKTIRDGWLCTGDIAQIDDNGYLKILGRSDDMIIRAGMNIYPQEIESIVRLDKRVNDVYVYGVENNKTGVGLAMDIVGDFESNDEVRKMCCDMLPAYQVPVSISIVPSLNKTPTGKIVRKRADGRAGT